METEKDNSDIHTLHLGEREITLVGTAHISKESAELTEQVIEDLQPEAVCIELDEKRFKAIKNPERWKDLNLVEIIKKKQFLTFVVSLLGSSWQKKLGDQTGAMPGSEFMSAIKVSENLDIPVHLSDRDMTITLKRVWRLLPFTKKLLFIFSCFKSLFDSDQLNVSEEQLKELRQQDAIQSILDEWSQWLPTVKQALLDERDIWMAEKIKGVKASKIVAVVGAAHVAGIKRNLNEDNSNKLEALQYVPPPSNMWKVLGWAFPVLILGSIVVIGFTQGYDKAYDNALYWFFANAIPCGFGALLAMAHPLTVMTAFFAAPFTSLTPVIGASYVAAFVQSWKCPPKVGEFHGLSEDIGSLKKWWSNRVLKIFLIFILSGLGSTLGSVLGGIEIFKNLFS